MFWSSNADKSFFFLRLVGRGAEARGVYLRERVPAIHGIVFSKDLYQ
jgi:hypothetical protein